MIAKSNDYKIWKQKQNYKNLKRRSRRKFKKKISKQRKKRQKKNNLTPDITFTAPKILSIISNPEQTIKFLNDIIFEVEKIRKLYKANKLTNYIRLFKIDMLEVEQITSDALMYLLTIIKNTRGERSLPINWLGNFPKNEDVKQYLKRSGYLNYMQTAHENILQVDDNINIKTGVGYEYLDKGKLVDIRQQIIDFTCIKLNTEKTKVNYLMTMLTEMITNIRDHAYDKDGLFKHSWYIFVENKEDRITYTFMDNGLGIPSTIRKSVIEKLYTIFDIDKEYKYIEAAVNGIEKRSETGLIERGNGLPSIYEQFTNKNVENFVIISNKAFFEEKNSYDLINNLNGTIFYWEIKKEGEN